MIEEILKNIFCFLKTVIHWPGTSYVYANVLYHCIVPLEELISNYLRVISKQQYPGRYKPTEISEDPNLI